MQPAEAVEESLRELIADPAVLRLPSLSNLAGHYGISMPIMRAVLKNLKNAGLIALSARRRAIVVKNVDRRMENAPLVAATPENALYQRLRSRIESGTYRSGQPLPKTAYLAASEHVATQAVVRVCRRLLHDGLAHRKGRSLIAGRPSQEYEIGIARERRCVLIVQERQAAWKELSLSWWTLPFVQSFLREMSLHGVAPRTALLEQTDSPAGMPAGKAEISALVDHLGGRLLGFLIDDMGWSQSEPHRTRHILQEMRWLCTLGKPVVSFDCLEQMYEPRVAPELRMCIDSMMQAPEMKRFFRCYLDGGDSVCLAIAMLSRLGHRIVGFPTLGKGLEWMHSRREDLRSAAAMLGLPVRVLDSQECSPLFAASSSTRLEEVGTILSHIDRPFASTFVRRVEKMGKPSARFSDLSHECRELVLLTAHLAPFLMTHGLTAFIAPSDTYARQIYRWLIAAGFSLPESISLLSFDDRQEVTYPHAISSVNFGFDNLGFTAFHALLGDIPVKIDKWRSVAAKSRINHYATIGPAPSPAIVERGGAI